MVDCLCRDHTIAKGLSLKFATSGGLGLEAQWAGRQSEGLLRRSRYIIHGFTDEKALYTGSTWKQLVGGQSYSVSSALYRSVRPAEETVRCCVLSDYACLLARSVLRTSVAGSD